MKKSKTKTKTKTKTKIVMGINVIKCCGSCKNWFNTGMLIGLCEKVAETEGEPCTAGGDGKDCDCYEEVDNVEYQRRLRECR